MAAGSDEDPLGTSFIKKLPEELHDMLTAALSNTAYRLYKERSLSIFGIDSFMGSEDEFDIIGGGIWDDLAEPSPQMKRFIRRNHLRQAICDHSERECLDLLHYDYGPRISVRLAQRIFEQEVYDFGRSIGQSKEQALGHIIKVREDSSKCNIDLPELGDYESSECENILNYLYAHYEQLLAESNSKEAKQVKRYLQEIKNDGPPSEYHQFLSELQFNGKEPVVDGVLQMNIAYMEAADQKKLEEKGARKESRKARKAERRAQKEAWRKGEKKKSQKSTRTDPHAGMMRKEQRLVASDHERPAQVQPIEDREKPFKQKKKGRKLKSEPQLPIQSEALSEERDKHKKGRVGGDAQDTTSQKAKRKRDVGPQHSPFFQRSSVPKAKKHAVKKTGQPLGFQSPMIQ